MFVTLILAAAAANAPIDYKDGANWLCRPGRTDACSVPLDATSVDEQGKLTPVKYAAAKSPAIDCFYVYPTVSNDQTPNSDMIPNDEERRVIALQFARFGSVCRTFAPMYRQVTLTALRKTMLGQQSGADGPLAYGDVRAAFQDFLARDNGGRPFVLIGHSQGSRMLNQLIRDEIDGKPIQGRMLSAMLIGFNTIVPKGGVVGGDFKSVPLCRKAGQTGCVISYVSFRSDSPPPANSRFGKTSDPATEVACTNPAALAGGSAGLDLVMPTRGVSQSSSAQAPWVKDGPAIATDFVKAPGLLGAECKTGDQGSYLAVTVNAKPDDPRTDTISGDVVVGGNVLKDWGLHLIDVNIAQGDLIRLVEAQAAHASHKGH